MMRGTISLLLVLFFPLLSSAQNRFGFFLDDNTKRHSLPFELRSNLIIVKFQINGFLPLNFIIDTGVQHSILTDVSVAEVLGLTYQKKITLYGANRTPITAYISTGINLDAGQLHSRNGALLILEKDPMNFWALTGTMVHGIIGYELLSRFVTEINYDRKLITFHRREHFSPPKKSIALPLTIRHTKAHIIADLRLEEEQLNSLSLMIDTGASSGLTLEQDHEGLPFNPPQKHIDTALGLSISGQLEGSMGRIDHISLHQELPPLKEVVTNFADESYLEDSTFVLSRNGTIGGEVLKRYKVWLDYAGAMVYLKTGKYHKNPFRHNRSGIVLQLIDEHEPKIIIQKVITNSPAEKAGLMAGDQLLRVNHFKAVEANMGNISTLFKSMRKRQKVKIVYRRDGHRTKVKFQLKDLI
ncbi:aspartyl protease family protein [Persicobacter psychrovividus]|uniref:PDZ domain-containing protein n=1 Tax=Persicobacter psychrovividus TaxID=387638 RepID=A0ABN6L940_9BACT|nr:hypothetical protein PEPS_01220 [Persicobacter psychrovividus]